VQDSWNIPSIWEKKCRIMFLVYQINPQAISKTFVGRFQRPQYRDCANVKTKTMQINFLLLFRYEINCQLRICSSQTDNQAFHLHILDSLRLPIRLKRPKL
jgi:hypothetical protein